MIWFLAWKSIVTKVRHVQYRQKHVVEPILCVNRCLKVENVLNDKRSVPDTQNDNRAIFNRLKCTHSSYSYGFIKFLLISFLFSSSGGSVNLFGEKPLGIFKNVTELKESADILSTWSYLQARELKLAVTHPPSNYFQKMALWTEQGKLWKFPIDNEQGRRQMKAQ